MYIDVTIGEHYCSPRLPRLCTFQPVFYESYHRVKKRSKAGRGKYLYDRNVGCIKCGWAVGYFIVITLS